MAMPCNRVVLFPFPYQGHANPMFRLAAVLHSRGFSVTVFHTELRAPDPAAYPSGYRFVAVQDGTSAELAASDDVAAFVMELNAICAAPFRDQLAALLAEEEGVRCVVTDVIWYAPQAAARELGVPSIGLMTSSASSFWTFMEYPVLLDKGFLPVNEKQKDDLVDVLAPFRVKDLQRIDTSSLHDFANLLALIVAGARQSSGLILNTFDAIEDASITKIRDGLSIPVFTIGPLNKFAPLVESSFIPQDRECLNWLNTQPPNSVLYVSFGSIASMDAREFLEMAWGLACSKVPFIWVVRPSLVRGLVSGQLPCDLLEEIHDRAKIIDWAPQEEVLGHPSLCAFLTHNGWNSTIESISEGIPMICRPCFGDQMGTARYVCDVWRVGVEMEVGSTVDRANIQVAVEKLMNDKEGKEVRQRMTFLKKEAKKSITKGGSSDISLRYLVDFILAS